MEEGSNKLMVDGDDYAEWNSTLDAIVGSKGSRGDGNVRTLIIGGTDVGKTTFTRLLLNRWVAPGNRNEDKNENECGNKSENKSDNKNGNESRNKNGNESGNKIGKKVAVIDSDLGQSEIGPPACVALGIVSSPIISLTDVAPVATVFVGSTSPPNFLLEHTVAVRRLADMVGDMPLVVDTCGYLFGSGARRLNQSEFELVAPDHVVGLQRGNELAAILAAMKRRDGVAIHLPPVPSAIGRKPPILRTQRRQMRFAAYFQNIVSHTYSLDDVTLLNTWLGTGVPLAPHLWKYVNEALSPVRVYYGEITDNYLALMLQQPIPITRTELGVVQETLKVQGILQTVAPRLKHLLVGLEGSNGKLLGLGLIEAINFRNRTIGIVTPCKTPGAARIIRMGYVRVEPDGHELGSLKPGEL